MTLETVALLAFLSVNLKVIFLALPILPRHVSPQRLRITFLLHMALYKFFLYCIVLYCILRRHSHAMHKCRAVKIPRRFSPTAAKNGSYRGVVRVWPPTVSSSAAEYSAAVCIGTNIVPSRDLWPLLTVPSAVASMEVVERGSNHLNVSWTPPEFPNGRLLPYIIEYNAGE